MMLDGTPAAMLSEAIARKRQNLDEAALELGVHRNTISNWIHGRSKPNMAELSMIATTTHVDLDWLAGDDYSGLRGNLFGIMQSGDLAWPEAN